MIRSIPDVVYANGAAENKLSALRIKDREGTLEQLGEASIGGVGPCHMAVHPQAGVILAHVSPHPPSPNQASSG